MDIYTNLSYEILSLDIEPPYYEHRIKATQTRTEMFGNLCDAVIQCYKYEPQYEFLFKEDGNHERNEETGELLYKLDEHGEKIFCGYQLYPFINFQTLLLIQNQYEYFEAHNGSVLELMVDLNFRQTMLELNL